MTAGRAGVTALGVLMALVMQVTVFTHLAWDGVVPNLALLVVVAAAIAFGSRSGLVVGFCAGLALDLMPPADHVAGRWALAFVLAGYLAGQVRREAAPALVQILGTAAASSVVATSVFALSGLVVGDFPVDLGSVLRLIAVALCLDLLLTPLVVLPVLRAYARLHPDRVAVT